MLKNAINAEILKLKHSGIFIPTLGLSILCVLIGSGNYFANKAVFSVPEWQALWTQVALFYGDFFYPIMAAICAAYLWRMEHTNHNWNSLMTAPISENIVFLSKFLILTIIGFLTQLFLMLIYYCVGIFAFHFKSDFPIAMAFGWLIYGWIAAISISAMQLYLSMRIRSFSIPIGISFGFCIIGLILYGLKIGKIFPNSLLILGIGATEATAIPLSEGISIGIVSIIYSCIFYILATYFLKKSDISAA